MTDGWRERVARGAAWLLAARVLDQTIRVVRLVLLAQLLLPNAFGLLGVALVAVGFLQTFSETGVRAALVQREEVGRRQLDAAWTLQLGRGLVLFGLGWVAAPLVAAFFEAPAAVAVLRWMMVAALIEGSGNIAVIRLQRMVSVPRQCVHQAAGSVVDLGVSVALAWLWGDVRALIGGYLAGHAARWITGYLIVPYLPRLRFDRQALGELWSFGRWVLISSALLFLANQGDDLVVGRMLGLPLLAAYQMAYRLASLPANEWSRLVSALLFPLLSRLREDRERLSRAYLQALQLSALGAFPVALAIFLVADPFVRQILGANWLAVIAPLQILAFAGMARAVVGPGPLVMAVGRPHLKTWSQAAAVAVLVVSIVPLVLKFGLAGAAAAAVLRSWTGKATLFVLAHRAFPGLGRGVLRAVTWPALATAVAALPAVLLQRTLAAQGDWVRGIAPLALFAGLYVIATWALDRWTDAGARVLLLRQWASLRGGVETVSAKGTGV